MDQSSVSDAGTNTSYDALTALLGVKGHFRLVPQGSTPKPHIVIKRDYPKGQDESEELSPTVARFSFIAGKKFSVSKGQPLLFAVADQDGKTLLCDENTFLLEADIADDFEEHDVEEVESQVERAHKKGRGNIEGLPPKMRKSFARKTTYESYIEKELPSSLGFLGYPLGAPTPRVYCTAAVQTDLPPSPTPTFLEPIAIPRVSPSVIEHADKSPIQLPSPVSADHAQEPISECLVPLEGDETDDFSRVERSLSPMDLSSPSCSPSSSLVFKVHPLPETPAPEVYDIPSIDRVATPPPSAPVAACSDSSSVLDDPTPIIESSEPPPSETRPSEVQPGPTPPQSLSPPPQPPPQPLATDSSKKKEAVEVAEVTPKQPEPQRELSIKKELVLEAENPWPTHTTNGYSYNERSWSSYKEREKLFEGVPHAPRAMMATPRNSSNLSARAQEKAPAITSTQGLPTPISMKPCNPSTQSQSSSPPPDPKQLVYIPSGSSSNPLGIRPSSGNALGVHIVQKAAPKAPRSLIGTTSTTTVAKKPVVVGAKWSAARSSVPSSNASGSNGGLSASTSSSLTSLPSSSSPLIPSSPAPAPLSSILRYASPSPPPPPESDPPPPLPPQPSVAKWKRISSLDEKAPETIAKKPEVDAMDILAAKSIAEKDATGSRASPSILNGSLKRPHDALTQANDEKQRELQAKKGKASPAPPQPQPQPQPPTTIGQLIRTPANSTTTTTSTTATSSSVKPQLVISSSTKPQPAPPSVSPIVKSTIPQPLTHPLPPKPQLAAAGSSYRPPVKRERDRSPEPPDSKRSLLRTDWPSTQPSADYQLQTSERHMNLSVQKIVFNSDGSHVALIAADRTLRVWENKQPAAEVARLSHNSAVASACWLHGDVGVMTLTVDGMISTWTRNGKEWIYSKLFTIPDVTFLDNPANASLVYAKDRIAVTIPSGVKVYILVNGTWQSQRDIVRSGITVIRFVQDGNALVGGCRDGVLWYCEVPNGTLRVHAFLSMKSIQSIDVHPTGLYLLVAQDGGKSSLVTLKPGENKGAVERAYTSEKLQSMNHKGFPAVFATKGQAVLYGAVNGCALVWDRKKGLIVYGLKHPEGDPIQAAATFDGRPGVDGLMITGTKQGRLFWWPQPVAAAPSHPAASSSTPDDSQRKRQKLGS